MSFSAISSNSPPLASPSLAKVCKFKFDTIGDGITACEPASDSAVCNTKRAGKF